MSELKVELPPEVPVEEARLLLTIKLFEGSAFAWTGSADGRLFEEGIHGAPGKSGRPGFDYPAEELQEERDA